MKSCVVDACALAMVVRTVSDAWVVSRPCPSRHAAAQSLAAGALVRLVLSCGWHAAAGAAGTAGVAGTLRLAGTTGAARSARTTGAARSARAAVTLVWLIRTTGAAVALSARQARRQARRRGTPVEEGGGSVV